MLIVRKKPPYKYIERMNQCAFVLWFKYKYPDYRRLISAYRVTATSKRKGGQAKEEGLLAGYPDIFISIPTKENHGLYIEFKAIYEDGKKGRLSAEQKLVHADLVMMGYAVRVCYSSEEAQRVVLEHFAKPCTPSHIG